MDYSVTRKMPKLTSTAVSIVKKDYSNMMANFNLLSPAYVFTTENINGYYDRLDFRGKDVLTIVGSGDHILNAVLRGANNIDAFDISGFAVLFYYLKEAAVKALSYDEFIEFFLSINNSFKEQSYLKIRLFLADDVLAFWDKIYASCQSDKIMYTGLFRSIEPTFIDDYRRKADVISRSSSYLNEESYYLLQQRLGKSTIRCYLKDFYNFNPNGLYDHVFLSNIIQFAKDMEVFKEVLSKYISKLNIGGEIKIGYIYQEYAPDYIKDFSGLDYAIESIDSIYDILMTPNCVKNKDSIITYKKK